MHYSLDNGNRDALKPPKDLINATVGSGRWQILVTLMLSFITFIHLLNTGNETLLRPPGWWCKKPDVIEHWTDVQWILYSHYKDMCVEMCENRVWSPEMLTDGYFQGCRVYDIDYSGLAGLRYSERPEIDTNRTVPCPYGVHYSTASGQSLPEKYKMACSNGTIVSSLWLSSSTFGRVAGYVAFGALSDRIGRKSVIFVACGATPVTAILVAVSPDYTVFVVTSVLHGLFHGGFAVSMILVLEISTNSWRPGLMAITCCAFALGIGLTPVINDVFDSYGQMVIFINLLCVVMFVSARFLPESPAWYFCTRETKSLEKTLRQAAEVNQRELSRDFRLVYIDQADERRRLPERMSSVWGLLLQPEVACQLIGIIYLTAHFGLIFGAGYYAILTSIVKSHLANTLLAAATTFGMFIGQLCTLLMGHRRVLNTSVFLVSLSSLTLVVRLHDFRPSIHGPITTLLLFNIFLVSFGYGVLLNYNTRTFPTLARGTLAGICHSIWAIFVWAGNHDYLRPPRTSVALVIDCVIAALFSLNLSEVRDRELPDTISDCTNFKVQVKPKRWEITEITEDALDKSTSYVSVERPSRCLENVGSRLRNLSGTRPKTQRIRSSRVQPLNIESRTNATVGNLDQ